MYGMNDPFDNLMSNFMNDPFFGNQNRGGRNQQLATRNDPFGDPFGNFGGSLMAQHRQQMQNPFALMDQMMGRNMNGFNQMMNMTNNGDGNSAVYSSSSVMTYSNKGDGAPKVYQASSQVRQGPGGVKETRQMLRDSEKGIEKVAVGHHIGDRAHVIERKKMNGGDMEEIVNLENLDDTEVPEFNKEFESKLSSHGRSAYHHNNRRHLGNNHQQFALDDKSHKSKSKSKSKSKH
jgi:myeloid leukemia factor 1